jgi:6-pyruvoyltetrahydropterin/6-carboxytetrahydropterin synthase
MADISCTRRIEFDAAHRVMEHESKCKHLHGHRYALEATFVAPDLDTLGRVVEFGVIK